MAADFQIVIGKIYTQTFNGLQGVVKRVEFEMVATEGGFSSSIPQACTLADPSTGLFVALQDLTEEMVKGWVEQSTSLVESREILQHALNKKMAVAALQPAPLPWAPVVEEPVAEEPATEDTVADDTAPEETATPAG